MTLISQIKWLGYNGYTGPFYYGSCRLPELSGIDDFLDRAIRVTSACEGNADAINMYDTCRLTIGATQFCDKHPYYAATNLLGYIVDNHSNPKHVHSALALVLKASRAEFKRNAKQHWRFYLNGKEVDSEKAQLELYFGGATGRKGTWTDVQKFRAKAWAAAISTVLSDKEAQTLQLQYIRHHLMDYVYPSVMSVLFNDADVSLKLADKSYVEAMRAIFISFAVNNPTRAMNEFNRVSKRSKYAKWSKAWFIDIVNALSHSHIIYPLRYEAFRPVVERVFNIYMPITAKQLANVDVFLDASKGAITCLKDVQALLISKGYAPGPVDGKMGNKTTDAIKLFQTDSHLSASGKLTNETIGLLARIDEPIPDVIVPEPIITPQDEKQEEIDLPIDISKKEEDSTKIVLRETDPSSSGFMYIFAIITKFIKTIISFFKKD